mmetsp:Transcript_61571/g.190709  ORF Transcript_61571/g.190709 Transcript_61571/m.190709 type:complete len:273 (+) Transcript_61571:60-878(+)
MQHVHQSCGSPRLLQLQRAGLRPHPAERWPGHRGALPAPGAWLGRPARAELALPRRARPAWRRVPLRPQRGPALGPPRRAGRQAELLRRAGSLRPHGGGVQAGGQRAAQDLRHLRRVLRGPQRLCAREPQVDAPRGPEAAAALRAELPVPPAGRIRSRLERGEEAGRRGPAVVRQGIELREPHIGGQRVLRGERLLPPARGGQVRPSESLPDPQQEEPQSQLARPDREGLRGRLPASRLLEAEVHGVHSHTALRRLGSGGRREAVLLVGKPE